MQMFQAATTPHAFIVIGASGSNDAWMPHDVGGLAHPPLWPLLRDSPP